MGLKYFLILKIMLNKVTKWKHIESKWCCFKHNFESNLGIKLLLGNPLHSQSLCCVETWSWERRRVPPALITVLSLSNIKLMLTVWWKCENKRGYFRNLERIWHPKANAKRKEIKERNWFDSIASRGKKILQVGVVGKNNVPTF